MPKRIIPVSSGKGGVGKTTVATNFALSLSRLCRDVFIARLEIAANHHLAGKMIERRLER